LQVTKAVMGLIEGSVLDINADFAERVLIRTDRLDWTPSPMAGVERRMLDRVGDEVARATSIVRYAAGSHFAPHVHEGGEEFIVLDGVFQDEHGDYPAGSYVRNPPTSRHTPGSAQGCVIFVKLWQFDPDDRHQIATDMNAIDLIPTGPNNASALLFENANEAVSIEHWSAGAHIVRDVIHGAECLVLSGEISEHSEQMTRNDWLRIPAAGTLKAEAGPDGARLWIKTRIRALEPLSYHF
jgi:hypothetical protein